MCASLAVSLLGPRQQVAPTVRASVLPAEPRLQALLHTRRLRKFRLGKGEHDNQQLCTVMYTSEGRNHCTHTQKETARGNVHTGGAHPVKHVPAREPEAHVVLRELLDAHGAVLAVHRPRRGCVRDRMSTQGRARRRVRRRARTHAPLPRRHLNCAMRRMADGGMPLCRVIASSSASSRS